MENREKLLENGQDSREASSEHKRKLYPYIVWLGLKIYELSHRHNEGS
jgi:hypothetical protein